MERMVIKVYGIVGVRTLLLYGEIYNMIKSYNSFSEIQKHDMLVS